MNEKNNTLTGKLTQQNAVSVLALYQNVSIFFLGLTFVYGFWMADQLFGAPLTGPLVALTHMFTLGVILPQFMGYGYYYLVFGYGAKKVSLGGIAGQIILYAASLLVFLWKIHALAGGPELSISAMVLFFSIFLYLRIVSKAFFTLPKKTWKSLELWIDIVSFFYLFQASSFGAMIATNFQTSWFTTEIIHSIRIHSQSGLAGFFLLQYLNIFWRQSNGAKKNQSAQSKVFSAAALVSIATGLFLWTAVHDKKILYFYFYYAGVLFGATFITLSLFFQRSGQKAQPQEPSVFPLVFLWGAITAGALLVFLSFERLSAWSLFTLFGYLIFYGFFILANNDFARQIPEVQTRLAGAKPKRKTGGLEIALMLAAFTALSVSLVFHATGGLRITLLFLAAVTLALYLPLFRAWVGLAGDWLKDRAQD